ncbi:hypothetical protein GWI33_004438 [Rhynchophorus ferrugineus]|uniref:Uncharacterized protein n=1 Tax=Rhynchophorus ferrugineus TaxID=354439 RepID=A0A834MFJ0_RHYFE|nr:hypothetical protein GWI33_004438 [Rhynchophorus ferrugineus]
MGLVSRITEGRTAQKRRAYPDRPYRSNKTVTCPVGAASGRKTYRSGPKRPRRPKCDRKRAEGQLTNDTSAEDSRREVVGGGFDFDFDVWRSLAHGPKSAAY